MAGSWISKHNLEPLHMPERVKPNWLGVLQRQAISQSAGNGGLQVMVPSNCNSTKSHSFFHWGLNFTGFIIGFLSLPGRMIMNALSYDKDIRTHVDIQYILLLVCWKWGERKRDKTKTACFVCDVKGHLPYPFREVGIYCGRCNRMSIFERVRYLLTSLCLKKHKWDC